MKTDLHKTMLGNVASSLAALSSLLVLATGLAGSAQGAVVTVDNPSFESPVYTTTDKGINAPPASWTGVNSFWWGTAFPLNIPANITAPPDGSKQAIWVNGRTPDQGGIPAGAYQVLTATLLANTTYTLTVDAGWPTTDTFGGGVISLGYGTTPSVNLLTATSVVDNAPAAGTWTTWTSTFVTGAAPAGLGEVLRIELMAGNYANGIQTWYDDVRLTATSVPEPASLALLALGGLVCLRRRRA